MNLSLDTNIILGIANNGDRIHEMSVALIEIKTLNSKNLADVKKSLAEIHFKDSYDERIFLELMTNLSEIKPIEFFLDDREFAKNCKKGFANIANDLLFEKEEFSCRLLKDYSR